MSESGALQSGNNFIPIRGKVEKVCKEFAVFEDGAYAYKLQNEEKHFKKAILSKVKGHFVVMFDEFLNQKMQEKQFGIHVQYWDSDQKAVVTTYLGSQFMVDCHYGMNRNNHRIIREDIPIAKIVQDDEEVALQNERMQQFQALKAQAEEDEYVAKQLLEQEKLQVEAKKIATELTDEEYAKAIQEKEKRRYERHLEKKRLKKLKHEREQIEKTQQQRTEEARLNIKPNSGSTERLDERLLDMSLENVGPVTRVTPSGRLEDDGDFSDFYCLPPNVDPTQRKVLQQMQDEELARLLQEQEHKRSKAEVDRDKLREIEEQDERLAKIIEEQDKIRLKKAKQKWKQKQEAERAQEAAQRPLALQTRPKEHNHRRYRRNSFIQSMENGPDQDDISPHSPDSTDANMPPWDVVTDQRLQPPRKQRSDSGEHSQDSTAAYMPPWDVVTDQRLQPPRKQRSDSGRHSRDSTAAYMPPWDVVTDQRLQPPRKQRSDSGRHSQDSTVAYMPPWDVVTDQRLQPPRKQRPRRHASNDRLLSSSLQDREIKHNNKNVHKKTTNNNNIHGVRHEKSAFSPPKISHEMPDVERWLASHPPDGKRERLHSDDYIPDPASPIGSYHSDELVSYIRPPSESQINMSTDTGSHYAVSDPFAFNIATAIDPTFSRRFADQTERKVAINHGSRNMPFHEEFIEIEWDPNLHGSLRKDSPFALHSIAYYNSGYPDRTINTVSSKEENFPNEGTGVISAFVPVQGQRRVAGDRSKKSQKSDTSLRSSKDKNNCKQQ